jgi:hypothetical protein
MIPYVTGLFVNVLNEKHSLQNLWAAARRQLWDTVAFALPCRGARAQNPIARPRCRTKTWRLARVHAASGAARHRTSDQAVESAPWTARVNVCTVNGFSRNNAPGSKTCCRSAASSV